MKNTSIKLYFSNKKLIAISVSLLLIVVISVVFVMGKVSEYRKLRDILDVAIKYELDGRLVEARLELEKAIEMRPNNKEARIILANIFIQQAKWDDAFQTLMELLSIDGRDGTISQIERHLEQGETLRAIKLLEIMLPKEEEINVILSKFKDRQELIEKNRNTISAGLLHTVGVKTNGTVLAAGGSTFHNPTNVGAMDSIVAVAAGSGSHTVGLRANGTVIAVGNNNFGQCDVENWIDIISVSAGGYHTVGLKKDGTVVAVGWNNLGQCNLNSWRDIVAISADTTFTLGLKSDGTVVVTSQINPDFCIKDWEDIVSISAGGGHAVGLKKDGTVVATGNNDYGQLEVENWVDITSIATGLFHTVGLKSDGTVVATGNNERGQCNVTGISWTNIVSISAGTYHTVGLRENGAVVAIGDNQFKQCNTQGWSNIRQP